MKQLSYLFLVLLISACSSIDCPVNNVVATKYAILGNDGSEYSLTDSLTITSIRSNGDTIILLNKLIEKSSFSIPVSYSHPEDVLYFYFDNEPADGSGIKVHVVDTVWIKKEDHPHFESVDCNTVFFHTLTNVRHTRNYLDSIVIKNTSVTFDDETVHFKLYPKSNG